MPSRTLTLVDLLEIFNLPFTAVITLNRSDNGKGVVVLDKRHTIVMTWPEEEKSHA